MSLIRILLICLLCLAITIPPQQDTTPPNIIFILIDDQRADFLSFQNHPWIETPHIDRLAENGLFFDRAYVTTSLCSPSRASILTGQYAHTHRVLDNDTDIDPNTITFPQVLQEGGYETGFVGKWHMGGANDEPRPGFDYWVSFKGQGAYNNPELNIDGDRTQYTGYTPDILTELSTDFIREKADNDSPYFLYLSHKSIHGPFTPAPRHEGHYADLRIPEPDEPSPGKPLWVQRQRDSFHGAGRDFTRNGRRDYQEWFQKYSEAMLAVDESIGAIINTLAELGELDNTVVVYFSDNGYMMGEHGLIDKRVMYEESIRVPAIVHWPAQLPQPRRSDAFILNVDMGPTIIDIAGLSAPAGMHGDSFLPLIKDDSAPWRDQFLYEYFVDPKAVQTPTIFGLRTDTHSYMTYPGVWDNYELYDMHADPDQHHNLLGDIEFGQGYGSFLDTVERQDAALFQLVKPLDDRLEAELNELGASRTPRWGH